MACFDEPLELHPQAPAQAAMLRRAESHAERCPRCALRLRGLLARARQRLARALGLEQE